MKKGRIGAIAALLTLWLFTASGCVSIHMEKQVIVFADASLKPVMSSTATALKKENGLTLNIRYGSTDALKQAVDGGTPADLLVLGGKSATPKGSYTFGSPAVRALMSVHKVDNYENIAVGADGSAYSIAKPLSSKNYASAQVVVDFLLSKKGIRLLKANGFTLE